MLFVKSAVAHAHAIKTPVAFCCLEVLASSASRQAFLCRKEPREMEEKQPAGDDGKGEKRSFRLRVVFFFFANVLCRSAKNRNERCAYICFVLSAKIQKSAIRTYISRSFSPNAYAKRLQKLANRWLAKRQ